MKACIVCFSQTGNTWLVAEAIRERLQGSVRECRLLRLEEADPAAVSGCGLFGLGLPSFYFREPANVARFFEKMPGIPGLPFFFFVTHGGTPGDTFSRVHRLAAGRGLETVGFFECLGVDTYPPFSGRRPLTALGHPDRNDLDRAALFAGRVLDNARALKSGLQWERPRIPGSLPARMAAALFDSGSLEALMRLRLLPAKKVLAGRCTHCGWCVQNCPSRVISLDPDPVFAREGCIACYHCQRGCPSGAISCDWRMFRLLSGEFLRSRETQVNGKPTINQEPSDAGKGP
jgi:ferredoxin